MKNKKKDPIDHLDDVDVYVESRGLTKAEETAISEYLRKQKTKSRKTTRSSRKRAA